MYKVKIKFDCYMNIKTNRAYKNLNESAQQKVQITPQQILDENTNKMQKMQDIFEISSNQFKFDCGIFMANIKVDINNPFGLKYFADKSNNIDEFIDLIGKNISITGNVLTESDIKRLRNEYNKAYKAA